MFSPSRCVQNCERPSASTTSRPRRVFLQTASLLVLLWSTAFEDGTAQSFQSASRLAGPRRTPRRQQSTRLVRAAASPDELYAQGMALIDSGRAEGVQYVTEAAEAGNADAQCTLGTLFALGMHGVPQDPVLAEDWLQRAVDGGSVMANYNLGVQCATGDGGFTVDNKRALTLFKASAEAGHMQAMLACATMYRNGDGVPQDPEAAAQWAIKAATKAGEAGEYEKMAQEMDAGILPEEDVRGIQEKMAAIREVEKINPYLTKHDKDKKVVWDD